VNRLACKADLWYNLSRNIVCDLAVLEHCQIVTIQHRVKGRLYRMDSVSHHAPNGNTVTKHCNGCNRDLPATLQYFSPQKQNRDGLTSQCKQCHAARAAQYRQRNLDKVKVYEQMYNASEGRKRAKARYRTTHQEEIKQYRGKWHEEHREEQKLYCVEYNATHHEERLSYNRQYNVDHREEKNEKHRQYRKTERGRIKHRANQSTRHARKQAVQGSFTAEQIEAQLKRQRYRCYYAACGHARFEKRKDGTYNYHIDHTFPLSRTAGTFIPANDIDYLVLACPSCNLKKGNKLPHEWPEGGRLL